MAAVARLLKEHLPPSVIGHLRRFVRRGSSGPLTVSSNQDGDICAVLDSPSSLPASGEFEVRGWVTGPGGPVRRVSVLGGAPVGLALEPRPDVEKAHPGRDAVGFHGTVRREQLDGPYLRLRVERDSHTSVAMLAFSLSDADRRALKERKFQRLDGKLQCPKCRARINAAASDSASCSGCGERYPRTNLNYDFLPEDLRGSFKIEATSNVSANEYDPHAQALISRFHDGLILDCGAGYRRVEYPNVVNFEIVPYASTDVLGVNERLPFADETFDAAFSLAVLEHVKDPWASAKEISRVLKPGGVLYCVVPFLQPLHGYPHHYYNMTAGGLKNLFDDTLEIEQQDVLASGLPIWTLTWFLRSWVDGLSGEARERFLSTPVRDLIGAPLGYLHSDIVQGLSRSKNFELASATMLIARKPER